MMEEIKVIRINGDSREMVEDVVIEEASFTIKAHGRELVSLLCMPSDLEELAIGFLFTSGRIKNIQDIKKIIVHQEQCGMVAKCKISRHSGFPFFFRHSSASPQNDKMGISQPSPKIKAQKINLLMLDFQNKSEIFLKTGGVHSAGIADENKILIFKEDISRHNAIDKAIGCALKNSIAFGDKMLFSSGRISSEILLKAQKAGIPILISQSAPTNQAVNLARDIGMTLVGFARGNRMNIYSWEERVE